MGYLLVRRSARSQTLARPYTVLLQSHLRTEVDFMDSGRLAVMFVLACTLVVLLVCGLLHADR